MAQQERKPEADAQINYDELDLEPIMRSRREKLLKDRAAKQQELEGIDADLRKVEGYFNPGGATSTQPAPEAKPRATREPREGSRKQKVLDLINSHPDGLFSKQVHEMLGSKGDKTATGGINNALNKLKTEGAIRQPDGRAGMYLPATSQEPTPSDEEAAEEALAPS